MCIEYDCKNNFCLVKSLARMQDVKEAEKVLLIQYYANIIYT